MLDYIALIALAGVVFGVSYIIYLNKIHEKEIATKHQKDFSFGMTVYSGLAGGMIGIFQIVLYAGVSAELVWVVVGGFLNFAFGLPIYLSFKKGIFYGVKSLLIYQSFGSADVIDKAHHFVEFEIMCFSVSRVMNSKSIKISLIFEHPLQELHQLYSEVYSNCRHC